MSWLDPINLAKDLAIKYGPQLVMRWIQDQLKLENLPKLQRFLILAADQELAKESWKKFEAVVTKYGTSGLTLSGQTSEEIDLGMIGRVSRAIELATGKPVSKIKFMSHERAGIGFSLNISTYVWHNPEQLGHFRAFLDDEKLFYAVLIGLRKAFGHEEMSDPLYFLGCLSPLLVHYFMLVLYSHRTRVEKLDPLIEILASGIVPYTLVHSSDSGEWLVAY